MENTVQLLLTFIDAAGRSRKYPLNTVKGNKAALKLFETEMNEEEKSSVKKFEENIDAIYQSVSVKYQNTYTAGSLLTYRKRIGKLLKDYFTYGVDPTKMANWKPKIVIRRMKQKEQIDDLVTTNEIVGVRSATTSPSTDDSVGKQLDRHEFTFDDGTKALIITPVPIDEKKWQLINKYVVFLKPE